MTLTFFQRHSCIGSFWRLIFSASSDPVVCVYVRTCTCVCIPYIIHMFSDLCLYSRETRHYSDSMKPLTTSVPSLYGDNLYWALPVHTVLLTFWHFKVVGKQKEPTKDFPMLNAKFTMHLFSMHMLSTFFISFILCSSVHAFMCGFFVFFFWGGLSLYPRLHELYIPIYYGLKWL